MPLSSASNRITLEWEGMQIANCTSASALDALRASGMLAPSTLRRVEPAAAAPPRE